MVNKVRGGMNGNLLVLHSEHTAMSGDCLTVKVSKASDAFSFVDSVKHSYFFHFKTLCA